MFKGVLAKLLKRRPALHEACDLPPECMGFYRGLDQEITLFNWSIEGQDECRRFYLFRDPGYWKRRSMWIIGSDADDDETTLYYDAKGGRVLSCTLLFDGEEYVETLSPTLSEFFSSLRKDE